MPPNCQSIIVSRFGIASDTKSFVCVAIMQLVEQGKLSLDDPITKYVPIKLSKEENPIRIRHLMSHSSGLPDLGGGTFNYTISSYGIPVETSAKYYPFTSKEDFYRHLNSGKEYVSDTPGKRFYYNNNGFQILGDIIELLSGQDMDTYIKEHILDKLDMKRTTFDPEDKAFQEDDNKAKGYMMMPAGKSRKMTNVPYYTNSNRKNMGAAGGLFTSVRERINYAKMYLNGGKVNGNVILSEVSIAEMQSPQLPEDSIAVKNWLSSSETTKNYGFGLMIGEYKGYKMLYHGGNFIGCSSDFILVPELSMAIISAANNMMGPRAIIHSILPLLLGRKEKEIPLIKHRDHLKKLSGVYEVYRDSQVKITIQGAVLFIESMEPGMFSIPSTPILPNSEELDCLEYYFLTLGGYKIIVEFEIDDQGDIWLHIDRAKHKKIRDL